MSPDYNMNFKVEKVLVYNRMLSVAIAQYIIRGSSTKTKYTSLRDTSLREHSTVITDALGQLPALRRMHKSGRPSPSAPKELLLNPAWHSFILLASLVARDHSLKTSGLL
jgi:hypothetical protein